MVKSSADSLLTVINDILDFSKIEAGKLELDAIAVRPARQPRRHASQALALRAAREGPRAGLPHRSGRAGRSGRRLRAGCGRSWSTWSATPSSSPSAARSSCRSASMDVGRSTVCLHFAVRDTGIGIPATRSNGSFSKPFTQADTSTTRSTAAPGLGLAIRQQLVELMGGRIWVESEVGQRQHVPFHHSTREAVGDLSKPLTGRVDLAQLSVLIVDDNATNRAMLEETLTNWRMSPIGVSNGISAIAAMKQAVAAGSPFPLVLLDAFMPEMDGFAVVEQIKRDPNLAKATIMMLSSADRSGDAARCRRLGVACYLRKPIAPSDLFDAIQVALGAAPSEKQATYPAAMDGAARTAISPHPARGGQRGQPRTGGQIIAKARAYGGDRCRRSPSASRS